MVTVEHKPEWEENPKGLFLVASPESWKLHIPPIRLDVYLHGYAGFVMRISSRGHEETQSLDAQTFVQAKLEAVLRIRKVASTIVEAIDRMEKP